VRIGIEAWAAADVPAGRGRYVRELLRALEGLGHGHELVLLTRRPWAELPPAPGRRWFGVPGSGPGWVLRAARAAHGRCDVLLATTSYALPVLATMPTATVVYDLLSFHSEYGTPAGSRLERLTLPPAVRRTRALVCISEATRDELVDRFPRAAGKAIVTPLAAGPPFAGARSDPEVLRRHGIERPYVLSAATLEPRKNLPRLIEAFATLPPAARGDRQLLLVGGRGWGTTELDAAVARHGNAVRLLGFVSDADLAALYASADAVAYPALAEGFGLPVLEAMAAGAPVLTSNRSSLPEVGGTVAAYADPTDTASIRDALAALLEDPARREAMRAAGPAHAARFSWERTARETLAALERINGSA
jgi:glycosyltransferase involved in cell wall biosynthesis